MQRAHLLEKYQLATKVLGYAKERYPIFLKTHEYIYRTFDEGYFSLFEEMLTLLRKKCRTEDRFEKALKSFIKYSHEYLILQARLMRDGRYLHSSFDEVNKNVYQADKMDEYYLDGLLLSQFLWPNHYNIGQFFISQQALTDPSSLILNVPSGTGIYSYFIARYFDYKKLYSVDISPYSVRYAKDLLNCSSLGTERMEFEAKDIYDFAEEGLFDLIVCDELLEHLEDPEKLLLRLASLLKEDGRLFLTTAVYAAALDHIYLFKNVDEVRKLIDRNFVRLSEKILPTSLENYNPEMDMVPVNYACILKRSHGQD